MMIKCGQCNTKVSVPRRYNIKDGETLCDLCAKKVQEEFLKNIPRTDKVVCDCGRTFYQKVYYDDKGELVIGKVACSDKCLSALYS